MAHLEKIKTMDDREIQNWLRIIDVMDLKQALLGVDSETMNCIFRNMSLLAERVLREYIEQNSSRTEMNVIKTSIHRLEEKLPVHH
jgi:flagellar motor switch protein FliG